MPVELPRTSAAYFLQTRTETRRRPTPRRRCDALHLAHRVPMAFPTRGVRPWTRVWSQFRRWSKNGTWSRVLTALHASSRTRSAERHRDPRWSLSTRTSLAGFERRCDLSQPGRPYGRPTAPNGSSASTSRACHSACESSPLRPPRPVPSNRYSTTSPARARTNDWSSCSLTGALRSRRPATLEQIQLRSSPSGMGRAPTQRARAKVFVPSVTLGASRWPTAISCVGDVWRAASKTP